jgi:hypothetical protein
MPTANQDLEAVARALRAGQITVVDSSTGHWRDVYAKCPTDGHQSAVRRVVRGEKGAITQLTMRCPACGRDFVAAPEALYLA